MKIKYHNEHRSITKTFIDTELSDFTVITGLNGSGKSHLLEAITNNSILVEINNEINKNIVYFNYYNFVVRQTINNNPPQDAAPILRFQDPEFIKGKLTPVKALINQKINNISNQYNAEDNKLSQLIIQKVFHENIEFLDEIATIEEIKDYMREKGYNIEGKENTISDIHNNLKVNFKDLEANKDVLNYYKISKNKKIHLRDLSEGHLVYNETFLGQELENEFKQHAIKCAQNAYTAVLNTIKGNNEIHITKEKVMNFFGIAPWDFLNIILREYNCNNYYIDDTAITYPPSINFNQQDYKIDIRLKNEETNKSILLTDLSSGEKTLLALALTIYRGKKGEKLPDILLLDEIDANLHPSMIKKLINVIHKVFIEEFGMKVILATHSPTTIACAPEQSIFVVDNTGEILIRKENKEKALEILTEGFASLSNEESELSIEYNIENTNKPILFTEGISDKIILRNAWEKLNKDQDMPFIIQDCFDATFLKNLITRQSIFQGYPEKLFISLFDFDECGYNQWNDKSNMYDILESSASKCLCKKNKNFKSYTLLLPCPENEEIKKQVIRSDGTHFANQADLPIELLLYGTECLKNNFVKQEITGGGTKIVFQGDKIQFARDTKNLKGEDFKNFKQIFDKINEIINY